MINFQNLVVAKNKKIDVMADRATNFITRLVKYWIQMSKDLLKKILGHDDYMQNKRNVKEEISRSHHIVQLKGVKDLVMA